MESLYSKAIGVMVGMVTTAYGYIFYRTNKRIEKLEADKPVCRYKEVDRRLTSVEQIQKEYNPIIIEIRERLSGIEATLEYLKKK